MFKVKGRKRDYRSAFSLVEIMIVVAIMAILAVSVGNILGGSTEKSKYARAEKDLDSIYQAFINVYNYEDGGFGGSINGTAIDFDENFSPAAVKDNVQRFLNKPIEDVEDPWGEPYKINADWNETTKQGAIFVYCEGASDGKSENVEGSTVRLNLYTGEKKMMRYIINQ